MPIKDRNTQHARTAVIVLQLLVASVFVILFGRLIYLQVFQYDIYLSLIHI